MKVYAFRVVFWGEEKTTHTMIGFTCGENRDAAYGQAVAAWGTLAEYQPLTYEEANAHTLSGVAVGYWPRAAD